METWGTELIKRLTGTVQPYAWGSPTFVPELLGEEPTGEPQAELWLGAHPSAPSQLDGQSLERVVAQDPNGVVGAAAVETFGPTLPFLLKVLAADRPLSLQAHPSRAQAEEGFGRENAAGVAADAPDRLYRDDWPKPELLCALMDSEALCGFREPAETYALFAALGSPAALALVAPLHDDSRAASERLEMVFATLLRLSDDEREVVNEAVAAGRRHADDEGPLGQFAVTARDLGASYPRDPGVLAALLMNRVALRPTEAIFLPAGNLHAYLYGGGIEIMANSDNVLRGGLTPKHIDVDELLSILDFTPGFAGLVEPVEESDGVWRYPTPAPEFALWRVELGGTPVELPGTDLGRVLLVTGGSVTVSSDAPELTLIKGQSAFATAGEDVRAGGRGTLFVSGPGVG